MLCRRPLHATEPTEIVSKLFVAIYLRTMGVCIDLQTKTAWVMQSLHAKAGQ